MLQTMRGKNNHSIVFNNACVIDKGNYRVRKTLESWHTAKTVDAENNSKLLTRQYSILLQLDLIYIIFFTPFFTLLFVFYFNKFFETLFVCIPFARLHFSFVKGYLTIILLNRAFCRHFFTSLFLPTYEATYIAGYLLPTDDRYREHHDHIWIVLQFVE